MKKMIRPGLMGLFFIIVFSSVFCMSAFAADLNFTAPAGSADYQFSIDLKVTVNDSAPYSGVQFAVLMSNDEFLKDFKYVKGTTPETLAKASPYLPVIERDYYEFGFYSSKNVFTGSMNAGKLNFTYSGSEPQTVTFNRISIVRLNEATKTTTKTELTGYVVNIKRAPAPGTDPTPGTDPPTTVKPDIPGPGIGPDKEIEIVDKSTPQSAPQTTTKTSFASFIKGFEDNTFRGSNPITREEFVTILYRLKNPASQPTASKDNPSFGDVAPARWSYDAIEWAKGRGIVEANAAGNFRPAEALTRAEMAVMLVKTENFTEAAANTFTDVSGHNDATAILRAVKAGIFEGYPDNTFRPEGSSTRSEAVTALVRYLLGGEPADSMWANINLSFTDVTKTNWAYKYIALAVNGYTSN